MTRSKVKVKVTRPLKLEIFQFSSIFKIYLPGIFNVSWQMTTDSETTEQYLNFVRTRFLIYVLVCVSRTNLEVSQISEESTAVPYGDNFYMFLNYKYGANCLSFCIKWCKFWIFRPRSFQGALRWEKKETVKVNMVYTLERATITICLSESDIYNYSNVGCKVNSVCNY